MLQWWGRVLAPPQGDVHSNLLQITELFFVVVVVVVCLFVFWLHLQHIEFPGQRWNPSLSCNLRCSCGHTDSLIHCTGQGLKLHCHRDNARSLSCSATVGTPDLSSSGTSIQVVNGNHRLSTGMWSPDGLEPEADNDSDSWITTLFLSSHQPIREGSHTLQPSP